ncbi:MAG: excinuclease ABC subunit UvrB [FCB group bacterium]|nr:excinuclease ABC subunit UvrB [FCB group bacterium]MBL7028110.1 excinuclease ABC subunit UvrB [Candidatus Neomarinimicrobiota bacterium]MBL7122843.1 excinuclease ABC subunit UvrB [Candidatus Neomarinimicrobiota bacterium]
MMAEFKLKTEYSPSGDQPEAIEELIGGLKSGAPFQTLLGVTGSGKTYTVANVIQEVQKPTLIVSHNKTLAAQLYGEFKSFFPENAVEYFISYYDYYQPEAYLPVTDTFIEKDMSMNEEIDKLRLKATSALLSRKDVIVVASVSCIYGLGDPQEYKKSLVIINKGQSYNQRDIMRKLVDIYYERNDINFIRGKFRVRGDVLEIFPAYNENAIRIEFWGNQVTDIMTVDPLTGEVLTEDDVCVVYPARHFVTSDEHIAKALGRIEEELKEQVGEFRINNQLLEAQRIEQRTKFDMEMLREVGHCSGIENYSRHLTGRKPGERPFTLLDFFPDDFLMIIDESHVTLPQFRGMYNGDYSRKRNLVDYGFRLPSALDNRPLKLPEFEDSMNQVIFTTATPADYELEKSDGVVIEQVIRPTGLLDPVIDLRSSEGQIDDLMEEINKRIENKERVLVVTLTKRMSEDLTDYLTNYNLRVRYLHSEIDSIKRISILRDLRLGEFDVLVGINLLREGLDLPEVSLVAIIDADKEGFLRSKTSLMQISGRAARHANGKVILYADRVTASMQYLMDTTQQRRERQIAYNKEHGIVPITIYKTHDEIMGITSVADAMHSKEEAIKESLKKYDTDYVTGELLDTMRQDMLRAAEGLDFEKAAMIRDEIKKVENEMKR